MFISKFESSETNTPLNDSGSFTWQSPSNIALVKYWGKTDPQLPKNPSISITLENCHTKTTLRFKRSDTSSDLVRFKVYFEKVHTPEFEPKIRTFLERILPYQPFLSEYEFEVHTENSFPHSSGIASSASGMSALALCFVSLEKHRDPSIDPDQFIEKASFLARLGSGSACRSLQGPLVVWGEHDKIEGSSDLYGIPYPYNIHETFSGYRDSILLVDKGVKQVSSTVGHGLMFDHPYSESRFIQAEKHMEELIPILEKGDLDGFIRIVEKEALALHAMMLTSEPYFILMRPNTLEIIERVWKFRRQTGSKLCFTLDAGANVHLLYPGPEVDQVQDFIENQLAQFCQGGQFIHDFAGPGARSI